MISMEKKIRIHKWLRENSLRITIENIENYFKLKNEVVPEKETLNGIRKDLSKMVW